MARTMSPTCPVTRAANDGGAAGLGRGARRAGEGAGARLVAAAPTTRRAGAGLASPRRAGRAVGAAAPGARRRAGGSRGRARRRARGRRGRRRRRAGRRGGGRCPARRRADGRRGGRHGTGVGRRRPRQRRSVEHVVDRLATGGGGSRLAPASIHRRATGSPTRAAAARRSRAGAGGQRRLTSSVVASARMRRGLASSSALPLLSLDRTAPPRPHVPSPSVAVYGRTPSGITTLNAGGDLR